MQPEPQPVPAGSSATSYGIQWQPHTFRYSVCHIEDPASYDDPAATHNGFFGTAVIWHATDDEAAAIATTARLRAAHPSITFMLWDHGPNPSAAPTISQGSHQDPTPLI